MVFKSSANTTGSAAGTVTSVSVVTANGFSGSVASPTTTPAITLTYNGSLTYTSTSSTYAILTTDDVVECTSGTFTATLPTAVGVTGKAYVIKNSGTGVITIATTSAQTIDGITTKNLNNQYDAATLISNGANWVVTA